METVWVLLENGKVISAYSSEEKAREGFEQYLLDEYHLGDLNKNENFAQYQKFLKEMFFYTKQGDILQVISTKVM